MAILKRDKAPKDFEKINVFCEVNDEEDVTICYNEKGDEEFRVKGNIYETSAPRFINYRERILYQTSRKNNSRS